MTNCPKTNLVLQIVLLNGSKNVQLLRYLYYVEDNATFLLDWDLDENHLLMTLKGISFCLLCMVGTLAS